LPISLAARGILLDIEGTTSSIRFVRDVLFPYVRKNLRNFLNAHWDHSALPQVREAMAHDAGFDRFEEWYSSRHGFSAITESAKERECKEIIAKEAERLMDMDAKSTGLKELQGLIWEDGYHSGELKAQVYDDVVPALTAWKSQGALLRIYSSGSIHAQHLFFGHSEKGNLLPLFTGHYDTHIGGKKEASSYRAIAADFGLPAGSIAFFSDIADELEAARAAGMQVILVERPGNTAVPASFNVPRIKSFAEVDLRVA
jgi:enolase-phosphatase E1